MDDRIEIQCCWMFPSSHANSLTAAAAAELLWEFIEILSNISSIPKEIYRNIDGVSLYKSKLTYYLM